MGNNQGQIKGDKRKTVIQQSLVEENKNSEVATGVNAYEYGKPSKPLGKGGCATAFLIKRKIDGK